MEELGRRFFRRIVAGKNLLMSKKVDIRGNKELVKKSFSAYQIELAYLEKNSKGEDVQKYQWNFEAVKTIFEIINLKRESEKTIKQSGWTLSINDLVVREECLLGELKFVEYGFKSNLFHVDNYVSRENPRDLREGEEKFLYFYIRGKDGLMLLQNDIRVNRSKLDTYIDAMGKNQMQRLGFTSINIANLLRRDFFDEISELDKIKKVILEVKTKGNTGENEVIQRLQGDAEDIEATHVQLSYSAKRIRKGMQVSKIIPFVKQYKGKQGIQSIKIVGEQAGADKNIYVNKYSEKYKADFKTDENNMLIRKDVYEKIKILGESRETLGE